MKHPSLTSILWHRLVIWRARSSSRKRTRCADKAVKLFVRGWKPYRFDRRSRATLNRLSDGLSAADLVPLTDLGLPSARMVNEELR